MTFRNTALLFFIFLLLNSCKGLQYYKSGTNPAGVSIIFSGPNTLYTNLQQTDTFFLYLINHNSKEITISDGPEQSIIVGRSRFYHNEIVYIPTNSAIKGPTKLAGNDTILLFFLPAKEFLGVEKNWINKNKAHLGPQWISPKKTYPYFYLETEYKITVPNQNEVIKVRSNTLKISVTEKKDPILKNKKTILSLTSDTKTFDLKNKSGNLLIKITNTGSYPIPLFNDPGSVRFKIYAYNANRTAIMFTQYVLDNGKLPIEPVSININSDYSFSVPLEQLLFNETPSKPVYYWAWNKKSPPVSPLIYGKKDVALDVEFWFGVVVDGKEYLSNTLKINIGAAEKKLNKTGK